MFFWSPFSYLISIFAAFKCLLKHVTKDPKYINLKDTYGYNAVLIAAALKKVTIFMFSFSSSSFSVYSSSFCNLSLYYNLLKLLFSSVWIFGMLATAKRSCTKWARAHPTCPYSRHQTFFMFSHFSSTLFSLNPSSYCSLHYFYYNLLKLLFYSGWIFGMLATAKGSCTKWARAHSY